MGEIGRVTFTPPVSGTALVIGSGYCVASSTATTPTSYLISVSAAPDVIGSDFVYVSSPAPIPGQGSYATFTVQSWFTVSGGTRTTVYLTANGVSGAFAGNSCNTKMSVFLTSTILSP